MSDARNHSPRPFTRRALVEIVSLALIVFGCVLFPFPRTFSFVVALLFLSKLSITAACLLTIGVSSHFEKWYAVHILVYGLTQILIENDEALYATFHRITRREISGFSPSTGENRIGNAQFDNTVNLVETSATVLFAAILSALALECVLLLRLDDHEVEGRLYIMPQFKGNAIGTLGHEKKLVRIFLFLF
ncbi:hypothetical protein K438DRAFT_1776875 [Mycena galopus ATCC 62051]|nr:hypothetical protein K438DRAFT_1776875 [Mycena galopus ATCC 62051]